MGAHEKERPKDVQEQPADLCHLSCGEIASERNRYYTGKYMTARDFQDEQDYFLSHHRKHNRLLHGWGIVCGLVVSPHPSPNCRDRYVVVSPGVAIDCCGREMVLREKTVVKIWEPEPAPEKQPEKEQETARDEILEEKDWEEQSKDDPNQGQYEDESQLRPEREPEREKPEHQHSAGPFLLVLRYEEEGVEWTPALYAEGACDPRHLEANRVRELACLEVHRWDMNRDAGCWPIPEPDRPRERIPCRDDCDPDTQNESPGCIEPSCPCKYGVPLALVTPVYRWRTKEWDIPRRMIGWEGRRQLHTPPEYLTHIVDYNWTHGGVVYISELNDPDKMAGKLRIYFDRRLHDETANKGRGVNEFTFTVSYHRVADVHYPVELLYNDENPPYVENEEGSCSAVFPIDDEMLGGDTNIGDCILYVTLKCDFILDCHYRLVDGDHLGGKTPTGNGFAGGTFESWFHVVDDEREKRLKERAARRARKEGR